MSTGTFPYTFLLYVVMQCLHMEGADAAIVTPGVTMTRLGKHVFLFCVHKAQMERSAVTNYCVSAKLRKQSKKNNKNQYNNNKKSHMHICHLQASTSSTPHSAFFSLGLYLYGMIYHPVTLSVTSQPVFKALITVVQVVCTFPTVLTDTQC